MAESPRQPCSPEPRRELGQHVALLALFWYPGLLTKVLGRAGMVSSLTPPRMRMRNYCAEQRGQSRIFSS